MIMVNDMVCALMKIKERYIRYIGLTTQWLTLQADSVGTALKTTSLRLRGTSVDILNEEGLDSPSGAPGTSTTSFQ